jgi:predicted AlkP superfamily phosphohydrolase/phosphomutase
MTRVLVVGLDGFDYRLATDWLDDLDNLRALMRRGAHGPLESIIQPVTPSAWTSMTTGRNPGHFGFTDFTARKPGSYAEQGLVHSGMVRTDTVFDLADRAGLRTLSLCVPVSYPPPARPNGATLSCIMTPSLDKQVTQPPSLQQEWLARTSSPFLFDVTNIDQDVRGDRDALLRKLWTFDQQRFDLAGHLAGDERWDLLFFACTGTDRIAHYFLHLQDPEHRAYPGPNPYQDAIREHYRRCDQELGRLLEAVPDDTVVMVASDHGVQRLDGKVNLNDWLVRAGYLKLDGPLDGPGRLSSAPVDWLKTLAWSNGFGGQVYLNRRGVMPNGCLDEEAAATVTEQLVEELSAGITDDQGSQVPVTVFRREDLYDGPLLADCPDLCVQLDGLRLLTRNSVGNDKLVTPPDDDGDVASHAQNGFFAIAGPGVNAVGRCEALSIYDVAPTILDLLGLDPVDGLDGHSLLQDLEAVYSSEDENQLASRLEKLYLD